MPEQQQCPGASSVSALDARVDQIQRWLFTEGGSLVDAKSLLQGYCAFCRSIDLPFDRLLVTGMMVLPQAKAYVWKWERSGVDRNPSSLPYDSQQGDSVFYEHEVPKAALDAVNRDSKEPFSILMSGKAAEYRMTPDAPETISPGCREWFLADGYTDYLALPMFHRGEFKGALAWSTKDPHGFSEEEIDVFRQTLRALSTVLRLHTNDIETKTSTKRLEGEIRDRTMELTIANRRLVDAGLRIEQQAKTQLKHFAMMSHEIRYVREAKTRSIDRHVLGQHGLSNYHCLTI